MIFIWVISKMGWFSRVSEDGPYKVSVMEDLGKNREERGCENRASIKEKRGGLFLQVNHEKRKMNGKQWKNRGKVGL